MVKYYSETWWLTALRGLAAIIFGIVAIALPDMTITALVLLFGAYAVVDGVLTMLSSVGGRETNSRWWIGLLEGILGLAAGVLAFVWPQITAFVLLLFIAGWALVTGVMEIIAAINLRRELTNEWLLGLSGALSIVLGVLLLANPAAGALALVTVIGIYAIIFGVMLVAFSLRVRSGSDTQPGMPSGERAAGSA
jgi:uncharacterized membrane protein HdeD (DUF308 family)